VYFPGRLQKIVLKAFLPQKAVKPKGGEKMSSKMRKYGPGSAWAQFKMECAQDIGRTQFVKENNDEYKGNVTSRVNGEQGGPIGGEMVKRMIQKAKNEMGPLQ
jgi:small acid-soluble spore protein D (minor alpha/beta-type SASP)